MTDAFLARLDTLLAESALSGWDLADLRLRILVDHFTARDDHPATALERVETTLQAALASASRGSIASLARKIASHPQTSAVLLKRLVRSGDDAAQASVEHGHAVDRGMLAWAAEHGGSSVAVAVAARENLDPDIARVLFRRTEREVLLALVANPAVVLDRVTASWLISRARHDDDLARAILARNPRGCDLLPLFLAANREEREAMLIEARRRDLGRPADYRRPQVVDARLTRAIGGRDRVGVAAFLAQALGIAREAATRFVHDGEGEALALALNVANARPTEAAAALRWLLGPTINEERMARLLALAVELAPRTARRIIHAVVGRSVPRAPASTQPILGREGSDGSGSRQRQKAAPLPVVDLNQPKV